MLYNTNIVKNRYKQKNPQPFPAGDSIKSIVQLFASATRLQLLEEVVAFVIHENEGWEVLNLNFPNGFHSEFGVLNALNALNVVLGKNGCWTAD